MSKWEHELFCTSSCRFFTSRELEDLEDRKGLYLAYVLSRDDRYQGDIFIFPITEFVAAMRRAIRISGSNTPQSVRSGEDRYKVYISKGLCGENRWYVRRQGRKFKQLDEVTVLDISKHYRNFACLERARE